MHPPIRNNAVALSILLALAAAGATAAPPPRSMAYQGELLTSGGLPVQGAQTVVFSLYHQPTGGSTLWSETDEVTLVDGRFQTELGDTVEIPEEIFNRQVWLGVKVGSDAEMTPRSKLTAAPVAFRAHQVFDREVRVPLEANPTLSGLALLAALTQAEQTGGGASFVVQLEAGHYDVGDLTAILPLNTTLAGAGRERTLITSTNSFAGVTVQTGGVVRDLAVTNPGTGRALNARNQDGTTATRIRVHDVDLSALAPAQDTGDKIALRICNVSASHFERISASAQGGGFTAAVGVHCHETRSVGLSMTDITAHARDGATATHGIDINGADALTLRNITAEAVLSHAREQAYVNGLAIWNTSNAGDFSNLTIRASANNGSGAGTGNVFGLYLGQATARISDAVIRVDGNARAVSALVGSGAPGDTLRVARLHAEVRGSSILVDGWGAVQGVGVGNDFDLSDSFVAVECAEGNAGDCNALARWVDAGRGEPTLRISGSRLESTALSPTAQPWTNASVVGTGAIKLERTTVRQLSGNGFGVNLYTTDAAPTAIGMVQSVVELTNATTENNLGCAVAGAPGPTYRLALNRILGGVCLPAEAGSCAATTTRSNDFLPTTCPTP
jgi:hypothetical protein